MSPFSVYSDWADEPPRRPGKPDHRKQSLYFPAEMLAEIRAEARRLDRSVSWVMQSVWRLARPVILSQPCQIQHLQDAIAKAEREP